MNVNKSSVRKDELSANNKTTIASRILQAVTGRLGTISRGSASAKQKEQKFMPLSVYYALEKQKSEDEATRHRAFLAARF